MNSLLLKLSTLTLLSGLIITPNITTFAYENQQLDQAKIALENIAKIDPHRELIESLEQDEIKTEFDRVVLESEKITIEIDKDNSTISLKEGESKQKPKIKIDQSKKPVVTDNKLVYTGLQTDTVIEPVSGGIRQIVHIKSHNAPKFYDFPLELQEGQIIELAPEGLGGSVLDQSGVKVLTIAKPWARDANKDELKTFYEVVEGNILRQHIVFDENTPLPISADPVFCDGDIEEVKWGRDGLDRVRLEVYPTWCGRIIGQNGAAAWDEVVNKTPDSSHWNKIYGTKKYNSLLDQFLCHYVNPTATPKSSWNLEPWRPHVGLLNVYASACNPE